MSMQQPGSCLAYRRSSYWPKAETILLRLLLMDHAALPSSSETCTLHLDCRLYYRLKAHSHQAFSMDGSILSQMPCTPCGVCLNRVRCVKLGDALTSAECMRRLTLCLWCPCREESDARYITNAADVKLRSFTTKASALPYFLIPACACMLFSLQVLPAPSISIAATCALSLAKQLSRLYGFGATQCAHGCVLRKAI